MQSMNSLSDPAAYIWITVSQDSPLKGKDCDRTRPGQVTRPGQAGGQVAGVPCQVSRLLQQGQGEGRVGESVGY